MYCTNCGSYLAEDALSCPNCNEPVKKVNAENSSYTTAPSQSGVYYTPQDNAFNENYTQQNYYQNTQENYVEREIKNNLSTANTLGILAIILGILVTPIAGIICGAIGLSKLNNIPDTTMNPIINKEKAKIKKLNTIGIVIPIILWVLAIIVCFVGFAVLGFASTSVF